MLWTYGTLLTLLTREQRKQFWLIVVLLMGTGLLDLAGVAMILPFLAVLADPEIISDQPLLSFAYETLGFASTDAFLRFLGLATLALVLSGIAVRAAAFYMANLFARKINMAFGMARLKRYLAQPYEWFLAQHSADLSKSVLQEINEIVNGSVVPALRVLSNVFQLLLLSGLLLVIEPVGALGIAALFGSTFWLVDRAVRQRIEEMGHDRRRANRERHQATAEALSGIKEVKMMALEDAYLRRFFDPSLRLASYQARLQLVGEMPRFALEALVFGGMLLFTLWLLWSSGGGVEDVVPVLGAFAFAALRVMPTAQMLFRDVSLMRFGRAALEGLRADLDEGLRDGAAPMPELDADIAPDAPALHLRRALRLEDVNYAYPGTELPALRDVTFEIAAGTTVGIMGPTGAGKSTVIDLVLGLVRPTEGRLLVDDVPITAANRRAWQRQVGFVPQSIHLVEGSVAANIAHGVLTDEIDMHRVRKAARMACIDDFVTGLLEGYDSPVGDAGIRLSGGQRQRIGIARALYRDQQVLVFDEATSALDPVTERDVMEAIRALSGSHTMMLVSHRLSTLAQCETIFMFRDGRIVDSGTYADLKARNEDFGAMLAAAE